jgi:nucleotide-binding universal stress UspA family protein
MSIVVGIDGSAGSRAALEYAFEEARRRRMGLTVVSAFYPPSAIFPYGVVVPMSETEVAEEVRAETQRFVDNALGERAPQTSIQLVIVGNRSPARVLIDAAKNAELLVVGHRGLGAIGSALLGSVALRCVLHAPCPVTVVPSNAVTAPAERLAEPAAAGQR